MESKRAMTSVVTILLVFATFNILPIGGQFVCPWCDKSMEIRLLDCVYTELVSRPQMITLPLQEIDNIKWKVSSVSDSMVGIPYAEKKVQMDVIFMQTIADALKRQNQQNNQVMVNVIADLAGKCYSSVTGFNPNVVTQDMKRMINENIKQNPTPLEDPKPAYPANQNNFQKSQPQIQPPVNPDAQRDTNYQPAAGNNFPFQNQPPVNGNPSSQSNWPLRKSGTFNPPVSQPVNTFNNPSAANDAPAKPPLPPPANPSNNPPFVNNGAGASDDSPPKDQSQGGLDSSRNQAPADSSSANDRDSLDYSPLTSTSSPVVSSPSQDSKSSNADSLDNSKVTTLSPNPDESNKKTSETEKSDKEEPCEEKFKKALFDKLLNDERFVSFFGKLPVSTTKPAVPTMMNRVFKEYGIEQHYKEFSTFWNFDSKTLNKESKAKDWDEVISKICKIIFSRNNLLDKDCEETGKEIADYILDRLPGESPASSAENQNQNDGNDKSSAESNTDSSVQNANPALTSTTIAPLDITTNPEDLSFPELRSRLGKIFDRDGSPKEKGDDVPLNEMLTAFETQHYLETLHDAAESCKTPSKFNFKKFLGTMTNVTDMIQKNHPDWSHDKCEKEMYSATVAVLTKELQDALKSNNDNAESQPPSNKQPDSAEVSSDSKNSNSDAKSVASSDYNISSDDSTDPSADTGFDSGNAPQPQQDFRNQGSYPNGPGSVNTPPSGNQPGPGNWNTGLTQPSNFAPGPVNTNNNRDFSNRNPPPPVKQPYESNYRSQNNGNKFSQPITQNYPVFPPTNMNTQPYPGSQGPPAVPNAGFQQSPNFAPNSGVRNSPNGNFGNNQYQEGNRGLNNGPSNPPFLNGNSQNSQPQSHRDFNRGFPAAGPVVQNRNNQQQFNRNDNSRFPANRPTIPQW